MAKLSDLVPVLARHLEIPEETVAVFARHLRIARLINTSGRGRGGANMTPADITNILLAMLSGFPAKDAAEAVTIYRQLKSQRWARDDDAPVVSWLEDLRGANLGVFLDRLISAAMTGELKELGRQAMNSTTAGNWYLFIDIMSPKPGATASIGGGVPHFSGFFRKHNKIIAHVDFPQGAITLDPNDRRDLEEIAASQRGWNSDRVRIERISRGVLEPLGGLLKK